MLGPPMVQNTAEGAERSPRGDGPLGQRPPVGEDQPACSLLFPAAPPPRPVQSDTHERGRRQGPRSGCPARASRGLATACTAPGRAADCGCSLTRWFVLGCWSSMSWVWSVAPVSLQREGSHTPSIHSSSTGVRPPEPEPGALEREGERAEVREKANRRKEKCNKKISKS